MAATSPGGDVFYGAGVMCSTVQRRRSTPQAPARTMHTSHELPWGGPMKGGGRPNGTTAWEMQWKRTCAIPLEGYVHNVPQPTIVGRGINSVSLVCHGNALPFRRVDAVAAADAPATSGATSTVVIHYTERRWERGSADTATDR
jgi:hypothetical protein